ncbi:hypothetical protein LENED_006442 [Lentinula edodes]|uniref:Uncharacterized protein n=1 Tax=Lentinula edodes TaxID=5353 RepID=A0A1Q3EBN2_LENED|nr:hypothetical protein LENED_006442 [Lentinula edodes]
MYYHSFLSTLIIILLTAPLSQCIQFSHITPSAGNNNSSSSSSSSLMLNWIREPHDPSFWALNAIFTVNGKLSASNGLGFEFIAVPHSPEESGMIQIPVQATANITLLTFTFNLPQHSKFNGDIFGQPFTFNVVTEGSSMPNISPGILPPMVQKMLTPPPPATSHKVATISDQGYSIEQSLAQLRGRMKLLLKQLDSESLESDRDSTDRIGDEAEMIQIKLEMDRLQRILESK